MSKENQHLNIKFLKEFMAKMEEMNRIIESLIRKSEEKSADQKDNEKSENLLNQLK